VNVRRAFAGFAASYFTLVFLKNGTLLKLTKTASTGAQQAVKGAKDLTKIT
jgi:hypothetical protein